MIFVLKQTNSKAIINIACGLNHSKEARDIFLDLVEKVSIIKHRIFSESEFLDFKV